jgi:hypothetical protein
MRLRVSENKRFLVYEDGQPFFFLADTAWELVHRLKREEAELYLHDRAQKKFTVIQTVLLAEMDGLKVPNAYGHTPLHDNDPSRPNEEYFQHVDWIIDKAESLGLFIGLLPTWGDKWNHNTRFDYAGPEIFTRRTRAPTANGWAAVTATSQSSGFWAVTGRCKTTHIVRSSTRWLKALKLVTVGAT